MAAGLTVEWYDERGVAVVEVTGEMDYSNAAQLSGAAADVLGSGRRELLVDLRGLAFMDSSGLGALIAAWKGARARSGALQLVCDRDVVLRMLRITGLAAVFDVHPSREDCFASLAHHRATDA